MSYGDGDKHWWKLGASEGVARQWNRDTNISSNPGANCFYWQHGSATMRTCSVYCCLLEPGQRDIPRSCPASPLSSSYVQSPTRPRRPLTRRSLALASILSVVVHCAVHTSPRTRGSLESKKRKVCNPRKTPKIRVSSGLALVRPYGRTMLKSLPYTQVQILLLLN